MTVTRPMQDLPAGTHFLHGGSEYVITTSAADDERGWVHVRNLSRSYDEALKFSDRQHVDAGGDPRDGFFSFSVPVLVEVLG